jgi:hypothetical protein
MALNKLVRIEAYHLSIRGDHEILSILELIRLKQQATSMIW